MSVVTKRQTTFKTVIKSTKNNGLEVFISRYSGASSMLSKEDMSKYFKEECLVMRSGEFLYLSEIAEVIEKSLANLFKDKGIDVADLKTFSSIIIQE